MKFGHKKLCLVLLISFFMSVPAHGAGTKLWNFSDIETWIQGEFQGTGLTSRGNVIPTMHAEGTDLPARLAWDSISISDGQLVATSLPAGIFHVSNGHDAEQLISLDQLGFTALEEINGRIYAAASPSGSIYEYDKEKQTFSKAATVPDSYVWEMQAGPEGKGLYLATGPNATLYYLLAGGGITEIESTPANNIMDLTVHKHSVFLGDDRGGLYKLEHLDNRNQPTRHSLKSIYGFKRGEVASLVSDGHHLYVAVNLRKSSESQQNQSNKASALAQQLRQQSINRQGPQTTRETDGPVHSPGTPQANRSEQTMLEAIRRSTQARQSKLFEGLSGTLVYRMNPPDRMNIVYNDPNEIVHDLEANDENLYVATGGKGRLYRIMPDFTRVAYFQTDHKLVLSLELKDGKPGVITTGEGAGVFTRQPFKKKTTYYRSKPMDAQLLSRWGTFKAVESEGLRHRTRSGNSNQPDTNWSSWSQYHDNNQFSITSTPARYLQFQTEFRNRDSTLSNVKIAYRLPNQQPQISSFEISPNPNELSSSNPDGSNGKKSQSHRGQPTPQANSSSGPNNVRQLGWQVMDPDGDQLDFVLHYRLLDSERWIKLADENELNGQTYRWDLSNVSDGRYEIKLTASDQSSNPPGNGYKIDQRLGPILVDNSAPRIKNLNRSNGRITFTALDKTSWILEATYRINSDKWQPIQPEDGIFDETKENFDFELPDSVNENDVIEVRIKDEGGNETLSRVNRP